MDPCSISISSLKFSISVCMVHDDKSHTIRWGLSEILCIEHLATGSFSFPVKSHVRLSICDVFSPRIIFPGKVFTVYSLLCEADSLSFKILYILSQFSQEKCFLFSDLVRGSWIPYPLSGEGWTVLGRPTNFLFPNKNPPSSYMGFLEHLSIQIRYLQNFKL